MTETDMHVYIKRLIKEYIREHGDNDSEYLQQLKEDLEAYAK